MYISTRLETVRRQYEIFCKEEELLLKKLKEVRDNKKIALGTIAALEDKK